MDVVEDLARERAKKLFGCEYVNVQPHSGAQANMAVMFAMLEPGDKIMGMNLDHGGHLTHGSPVNMSGKYFDVAHYGVNEDGVIDYDEVLRIAKEHQPKLIVAGASAYARTIDFKRFREIADKVGAYLMEELKKFPQIKEVRGRGLMIGLEFEEPVKELRLRLLKEQHVFTGVSGTNVLRLLPPLCLGMDEANLFLERFKKAL